MDEHITPLCQESLTSGVITPSERRREDFPSYQPCVDKRSNYKLDAEAYGRKLEAARAKPPKDPAELITREEQFTRAKKRFDNFSEKLVEDLVIVDGTRFEMANILADGLIESSACDASSSHNTHPQCTRTHI